MSLSLNQKKAVVSEVSEAIASARAGVLAEYRGLTVAQLTALRTEARNEGVWIRVVKNNLAKLVIEGTDFECLTEHFVGPVIFSAAEDPVAVARVMARFAKDNSDLKITAGAMNGDLIDLGMIDSLAKLPGRDELIAKLLGTMQAPMHKLVTTLNEVPSKFVRTVSAVAESREAA
jgi:large subunit ribosomal protein L10